MHELECPPVEIELGECLRLRFIQTVGKDVDPLDDPLGQRIERRDLAGPDEQPVVEVVELVAIGLSVQSPKYPGHRSTSIKSTLMLLSHYSILTSNDIPTRIAVADERRRSMTMFEMHPGALEPEMARRDEVLRSSMTPRRR